MRFRRKKGDEEEVVSGDVVDDGGDPAQWALPADAVAPEHDVQDDTVDMEAVAPATAAGGAAREDDDPGAQEPAVADEAPAAVEPEPQPSVSGRSVTSPGVGDDATPSAAASANEQPSASAAWGAPAPATEEPPGSSGGASPGGAAEAGALAPILAHPAVKQKPELLIVGGLVAGFVVAKLFKAMTSSGE